MRGDDDDDGCHGTMGPLSWKITLTVSVNDPYETLCTVVCGCVCVYVRVCFCSASPMFSFLQFPVLRFWTSYFQTVSQGVCSLTFVRNICFSVVVFFVLSGVIWLCILDEEEGVRSQSVVSFYVLCSSLTMK